MFRGSGFQQAHALKFDQRKDSPKIKHSKRQFLPQYTILKINNSSRLLTYRRICNRSCCFACKLHRFNRCSTALTRLNVCYFNCPFIGQKINEQITGICSYNTERISLNNNTPEIFKSSKTR